jgi:hypothetical protein
MKAWLGFFPTQGLERDVLLFKDPIVKVGDACENAAHALGTHPVNR